MSPPFRRPPFRSLICSLGAVAALSIAGSAPAQPAAGSAPEAAPSPLSALRDGTARVALRYRIEAVDDDRFADDALASTLRTTLAYESAEWRRWSLFAEAENVTAVPDDDLYANAGAGDLGNRVSGRPVVADPEVTEVNQAFVRWRSPATAVTVGRQEIGLGNQRFVGAVAWRQNHQSFDGLRWVQRLGRAGLDYGFVSEVHRIFGDSRSLDGHLLQVPIAVGAAGTLSPHALLLDFDDPRFAASSTATVGAELAGKAEVGGDGAGGLGLSWEVEYARQRDWGDHPRADLDLAYGHLAGGVDLGAVRFDAGIEVLEGDGVSAFQTPLATLHKFDGWADLFLVTPPDGLEALSLGASGALGPLSWSATYWDFAAENGGSAAGAGDYGRELDLLASWKSRWGQTFAAKAAIYREKGFGRDVSKLMLWTVWGFDIGG